MPQLLFLQQTLISQQITIWGVWLYLLDLLLFRVVVHRFVRWQSLFMYILLHWKIVENSSSKIIKMLKKYNSSHMKFMVADVFSINKVNYVRWCYFIMHYVLSWALCIFVPFSLCKVVPVYIREYVYVTSIYSKYCILYINVRTRRIYSGVYTK